MVPGVDGARYNNGVSIMHEIMKACLSLVDDDGLLWVYKAKGKVLRSTQHNTH